jgi:hypothetical protein
VTFEERLERLTERHEALTQTVELLTADVRELAQETRKIAHENREIAHENRQRDRRMGEIMEGIGRLLNVAEIHEQRIERLEEGRA